MYFWEHSPSIAKQLIENLHQNPQKNKPKIFKPTVLGAVIDLGHCLDLTDFYSLQLLKDAYEYYIELQKLSGCEILKNTNPKTEFNNRLFALSLCS